MEWVFFTAFSMSTDTYHLIDLGKEADFSADHHNNFMGFFEIKWLTFIEDEH